MRLNSTPMSRGHSPESDAVIGAFMKTAFASMAGSLWRIAITPLDTLKTTLQVDGKEAFDVPLKEVVNVQENKHEELKR